MNINWRRAFFDKPPSQREGRVFIVASIALFALAWWHAGLPHWRHDEPQSDHLMEHSVTRIGSDEAFIAVVNNRDTTTTIPFSHPRPTVPICVVDSAGSLHVSAIAVTFVTATPVPEFHVICRAY